MLFNFAFRPVEAIAGFGHGNQQPLHWFGLTDGRYWLDSAGVELEEKVDERMAKVVALIWVIDPQRKRARVYQGGQEIRLGENDTLTGGNLLPGLQIKLADLFEQA